MIYKNLISYGIRPNEKYYIPCDLYIHYYYNNTDDHFRVKKIRINATEYCILYKGEFSKLIKEKLCLKSIVKFVKSNNGTRI